MSATFLKFVITKLDILDHRSITNFKPNQSDSSPFFVLRVLFTDLPSLKSWVKLAESRRIVFQPHCAKSLLVISPVKLNLRSCRRVTNQSDETPWFSMTRHICFPFPEKEECLISSLSSGYLKGLINLPSGTCMQIRIISDRLCLITSKGKSGGGNKEPGSVRGIEKERPCIDTKLICIYADERMTELLNSLVSDSGLSHTALLWEKGNPYSCCTGSNIVHILLLLLFFSFRCFFLGLLFIIISLIQLRRNSLKCQI